MTELGVQRTQRLVHHASLGAPDECAAQRDALAVTAGKTRYGALQQVLDAQELGNLLDPPLALRTRHPLALEPERDGLAHPHVRVQREQLEHEADISLRGSLVGHILALEQDLAFGRQLKTGDHSQGGGLAAARGAEQHEEFPVAYGKAGFAHRHEVAEALLDALQVDLGHALLREVTRDDERHATGQNDQERVRVERERKRLHQHENASDDDHGRSRLPGTAAENPPFAISFADTVDRADRVTHLRTAPKVMPRSSCLRSRIVKHRMGTTNSVVAAATAGQSCPPSPMMKGMKGGIVCAVPLVSSTANAYSFQAKMRQNTAVAAMPVAACGSTVLINACMRV